MTVSMSVVAVIVVAMVIDLTGIFDWGASDVTGEVGLIASMSVVVVMTWKGNAVVVLI